MSRIPETWNIDCEIEDEKEEKLIPDKSNIIFYIHNCEEKTKKFKELESVEIWSLHICCETQTLKNWIWQDIYKDPLVWLETDIKGDYWVQRRFLNLCKGVSLRPSGSQEKPNSLWFTDPNCFNKKKGRATISIDEYNGEKRNVINWFKTPTLEQFENNQAINERVFKPIEPIDETKFV